MVNLTPWVLAMLTPLWHQIRLKHPTGQMAHLSWAVYLTPQLREFRSTLEYSAQSALQRSEISATFLGKLLLPTHQISF